MKSYLLASAMTLAIAAGAAHAQVPEGTTVTTQQTTTTPAPLPPVSSYSVTKDQKTINGDGTETEKSSSYVADPAGSRATNSETTTAPDGSTATGAQEVQTVPGGSTTTTTTTTSSGQ